jgi:Na+-translocating ferredoxin:NAD+ oxidoreductase RnfD subunit
MFNLKALKTQLIIYLASFALFLALKERDYIFLGKTSIALAAAVILESLIIYFKTEDFKISESAVISGLIVGYVLSAEEAWWKFILASTLAILSKHLIRFKGRHIFNPAAFGIFFATILFHASTQWKGTYLWYIIVPTGLYFIYKINKIEIILGYGAAFLTLFGMQAYLQRVSLLNIFGYLSYFYIFVMVIEPKTTPIKKMGKYLFGATLSMLIFILTEAGVRLDVELFSLLAMNITTPLFNKLSNGGAQ